MTHRPARPPSQRQLRVGEELRHALARVLERGDLRDPALEGRAITVTEIRVSPDMRNATAFVVPLGGGDKETVDDIVRALGRARPYLRHQVASSVTLKYVPDFSFVADTSFDEAGHIDTLLRQPNVARDLAHDDDAETSD